MPSRRAASDLLPPGSRSASTIASHSIASRGVSTRRVSPAPPAAGRRHGPAGAAAAATVAQHLVELLDVARPPVAHQFAAWRRAETRRSAPRVSRARNAAPARRRPRRGGATVAHDGAREELQQVAGSSVLPPRAGRPSRRPSARPGRWTRGTGSSTSRALGGPRRAGAGRRGRAPACRHRGELVEHVGAQPGPWSSASTIRRCAAGVQHWWVARAMVALPVPELALQDEPFAGCGKPVDRLPALHPQRPLPTAAGSAVRGEGVVELGRTAAISGAASCTSSTPPAAPRSTQLRPHLHPRDDAGREVEQHHPPVGVRRIRTRDQRGLVGRVDELTGAVVAHHEVGADGEHRPAAAPARGEVVVEEGELARAGLVQQRALDLARDAGHRRGHEPPGVLAPTGEVDDPHQLAVHRVPHGRACARELGERLDVVLVAERLGRGPPTRCRCRWCRRTSPSS